LKKRQGTLQPSRCLSKGDGKVRLRGKARSLPGIGGRDTTPWIGRPYADLWERAEDLSDTLFLKKEMYTETLKVEKEDRQKTTGGRN